ncbi:hypothetical protein BRC86_04450 [Halobacteriales archaeon QS_3_64_16]|nr:MAG: hypothetical protein BRC86_04450 [Halobacteriales archaeon QS_3_64_16]
MDGPSIAVGVLVACAGGLFLVEPLVGPVGVFSLAIRSIALSAIFLTSGFGLGAVLYGRRGRRLIGIAHAIAAIGFGFLAGAMVLGSQLFLFGGVVVLVGGSAFLVAQTSRGK